MPFNRGTLDAYRKIVTKDIVARSGSFSGGILCEGVISGSSFVGPISTSTHASTHTSGSTDVISIDASQVTSGTFPLSTYPTGSMTIDSSQVISGDLSIARVPTGSVSIDATQVVSGEFNDIANFSDALLTDIRDHTPIAHAGSHTSGSGDGITIYKNQISDLENLTLTIPKLVITGSGISVVTGSLNITETLSG